MKRSRFSPRVARAWRTGLFACLVAGGSLSASFAAADGRASPLPSSAVTLSAGENAPDDEADDSVELNSATVDDLVKLPGLGPTRARLIVDYRETKGPYRSIWELRKVKGIGRKTLARLRPYLHVASK